MFKKILSLFITAALLICILVSCSPAADNSGNDSGNDSESNSTSDNVHDDVTIRIGGLKGPTSMGLVNLMESNANGTSTNKYSFSVVATADEITPKLVKGELDMAALPANLASVLYNNNDGFIQLLAINTLGVIYIVENGNNVNTLDDLRGKTIYAAGKGSTPEYALRYILTQNGIDPDTDVNIEWKSEAAEALAYLQSAENGIAMLPQPYATVAQNSVEGLRIAIDLNAAWNSLDNGSLLVTGTLVVRKEFAEAHPKAVADFLVEYEASTKSATENINETAVLVEKYGIVKTAIAEKALPYCNITFISGAEMKSAMIGYLETLLNQKPAAIGNKLPGNDFYYEK